MAKFYKTLRPLTSYFFLLTSSLLLLTSCQEGSEAGDLFGQWRMESSESNYIGFSGSVAVLRNVTGTTTTSMRQVYGNFQHTGDSLFIQCYSVEASLADTIMVEETMGFKPFNNIRVKIESIDGDRMVLSKGTQHWTFYQY